MVVQSSLVVAFIPMEVHGENKHGHPRSRSINGVSAAHLPATAGAVKVGILARNFATMNHLGEVQSCLVVAFIPMEGHGETKHDHPRCRSINGVSAANYAATGGAV